MDRDAIQTAIKFWMAHDETDTAYVMNLSVVTTPDTADVVVSIRDRIQECDGERANMTFYWCGPLLSGETTPEDPERVEIAGGYDQSSTVTIAKIAIGHLYGVSSPTNRSDIAGFDTLRPSDPFFGEPPAVVGINKTSSVDRDFTGLVEETLAWWESQPATHKNYSTTFVLRPNATAPDIEVRFVEHIPPTTCEAEPGDDLLGCADVLSGRNFVEDALVRIKTGYTDASTSQTLKHEFGHIHGRQHNQSPMPVMSPTGNGTLLPQPDATDRAFPWQRSNLSYYLASRVSDRVGQQYAEQVRHAEEYYKQRADGHVPKNLTLTRIDNRSAADIVIIEESSNATRGDGSIDYIVGRSTDTDPGLEYYTFDKIYLSGLEPNRYGWHVGYWLGFAFGAETIDELPPPFDEPEEDPRESWWQK